MVLFCLWLCSTGFLICRSFCFRLAAAGRPYAVEISLRAPRGPFVRSQGLPSNGARRDMKIKIKPQTKRKTAPIGTVGLARLEYGGRGKAAGGGFSPTCPCVGARATLLRFSCRKASARNPAPPFPAKPAGSAGALCKEPRAPFERSAPRYENQNKTSNKAKDRPYWDGQSWRAWRDSNPRPFGS